MRCTIKFQLKKVLCLGVAVGNCAMNERELFMNIQARAPPALHPPASRVLRAARVLHETRHNCTLRALGELR